jgi:hypothetical protein
MNRRRELFSVALVLGALVSCAESPPPMTPSPAASTSAAASTTKKPASEAWGDVPDQPSASTVRAALDGPQENARKCVEPANGPYRVKIVFAYTGEVQGTEIAGSPSTAEDGCIRAALQVANVGPFRRAKFTLTTTISRP